MRSSGGPRVARVRASNPPPLVRIALFGALRIEVGGREQRFAAPPMTGPLLAYLLLHRRQRLSRETVAFSLWSEHDESQAKVNLRRHLYHLQQVLPSSNGVPWVLADAKTVGWNVAAPATIDVDDFESRIVRGERSSAASLYTGDLLEAYDAEWILAERGRLRALQIDNLFALVAQTRGQRQYAQALAYARDLQRLDPWREDALREVAALRYELGDGAGAIAEIDAFAKRLRDDLDADVMAETAILREAIARDEPRRRTAVGNVARADMLPLRVLPFVGRETEFESLCAAWERAAQGAGGLVLVGGEAGIGKSRLASALRQTARADGAMVLDGQTSSPEAAPYQALIGALAPAVSAIAKADIEPILRSALAAVIPEIIDHDRALSPAPALPPDREQERLHEAFARAVGTVAGDRPLLLIMEDLQWSGTATIALLELLARDANQRKILILATYRTDDVPRDHALRDMRRRLERAGLVEHLALAPLTPADVETLLSTLAGAGVSVTDAAALLYQRSDGNPFFLGELMRDGMERGTLRLESETLHFEAGDEPQVFGGIRDVMVARLRRLSLESRKVIELAAIVGRTFSVELLSEVRGIAEASMLRAINELLDRQLVNDGSEAGDYMFSHHLLQSAAYELNTPRDLRRRHLRVAEVIESLAPAALDEAASRVALHLERGGENGRAAAYHVRAARRTLALNANDETKYHCDRALALSEDPAVCTEALFMREEVHRRRGDSAAQRSDLEELEALHPGPDDAETSLEIQRRRVALAHGIGDADEEGRAIATLRESAARHAAPRWTAVALQAEGRRLFAHGKLAEARSAFLEALSIPTVAADARLSGELHFDAADASIHAADYAAAEGFIADALALARNEPASDLVWKLESMRERLPQRKASPQDNYRRAQDLLHSARALGDQRSVMHAFVRMGTAALYLFKIPEADANYRLAHEYAEKLRTPKYRSDMAITRAVFDYAVGDFSGARSNLTRAKSIASESGDEFAGVLCDLNLSLIAFVSGDPRLAFEGLDGLQMRIEALKSAQLSAIVQCLRGSARWHLGDREGLRELEAGVARQRDLDLHRTMGNDLAELTLAYAGSGQISNAVSGARELVDLSEVSYCGITFPQFMLWAAAQAYEAAGDRERATELYTAAHRTYQGCLDQIADAHQRVCFTAIPLNRDIAAYMPPQLT